MMTTSRARLAPSAAPMIYLLHGKVMHQRCRPVLHRFVYPVFFLRINLSRLTELQEGKNAQHDPVIRSFWFGINRWRILSLRTRDYGARDDSDLATWMHTILTDNGIPANGDIWLQTFPRLFGFVFNPVSFWYCHDTEGKLRAVLAEVNNTFGEHHRYLLQANKGQVIESTTDIVCTKQLHVSPFCQVRGWYRFRFHDAMNNHATGTMDAMEPLHANDRRNIQGSCQQLQFTRIKLDYHDDDGEIMIRTCLSGKAEAATSGNLMIAILRQPLLTLGIIVRIHLQALRLGIKRVPFYGKSGNTHPRHTPDTHQTNNNSITSMRHHQEKSS